MSKNANQDSHDSLEAQNHYDVIIIGSGPAGYTAGIYTSRANLGTLIISGTLPGGQLMTTSEVENYPGFPNGIFGPELMMNMRQQAERFGAVVVDDEAIKVDFKKRPFTITTHVETYTAEAVIICTGASPRKFGISVRVVHRRDSLRASKILQQKALENPKIEFVWNNVVADIKGSSKISTLLVKDINTGKERTIKAGGLFVAIGHEPNTAIFRGQLELDDKGYIVLTQHTRTSVEGVFAAGDVHDHRYRQAVTAAGFGCMAAIDAEKWLSERKHSAKK